MSQYDKPKWGKLTEVISIPVDEEFKSRMDKLKEKKKVNEWARETLLRHACELEENEPEPAA